MYNLLIPPRVSGKAKTFPPLIENKLVSQSITGSVTALSHSGLDLVNALFVPVTELSVSET